MNVSLEIGSFQHILLLWFCVSLCVWIYLYVSTKKKKFNLFPGPRGLPLLGNLPFLGKNPHIKLSELGQKYGGVFSIYLGKTYVVVVTDVMIAKQLLVKASTADRPPGLFQLMPNGVGLADLNGSEWVEQRRYTIMQMKNLGFGRSHWEKLVQMEVSDVLKLLKQTEGEPTDVSSMLATSISNNVLSLVSDKRLPLGDPRRNIVEHGVESFQRVYNPSGLTVHYPKLFKLLVRLGLLGVGELLKNMLRMHAYIKKEIEELAQKEDGHSFIAMYLDEIKRNRELNLGNTFNENNLIGNVQALVMAGSDTTYVSLTWLLLAMASHPEIQTKLHAEIDAVVGRNESLDWVDRKQLPYCLATIQEGQRWRTIVPLNLLHRSTENIVLNGYDIPKGTNIMTNLWAFHNDLRYWENPDEFRPERFLSEDGRTVMEPEAYLPFSHGKRVCPGKTVALIELFQYFVSIMQNFQVLPASETCKPNLEGFPGLTLQPERQPLCFVAR